METVLSSEQILTHSEKGMLFLVKMGWKRTTELKNKLFVLIRSGFDLDVPAIKLTEEDCSALLQIGKRQSILPILYRGIKKMEAPEDAIRSIDKARLKDIGQTIRINYSIDIISAALEKAHILYILLKGAVLRPL